MNELSVEMPLSVEAENVRTIVRGAWEHFQSRQEEGCVRGS